MKFKDIPQLPRAHYQINVPWTSLEDTLDRWINRESGGGVAMLNMDPDYQREHVWTREQQIAYVSYSLQGGEVGKHITFNCPGWMGDWRGPFELVDGKQRIEAVRAFMRDEFRVFGSLASEFDRIPFSHVDFLFRVCTVEGRQAILDLYLNINAGGTPHSREELDRVRALRDAAVKDKAA